ncbi:MAG: hypothetical protein B6U89_02025 [Desulfurococcales archaeon ex4484_58]|nr:MAG: hypothetical protein B6U89_02025 [Desulfurococcales archaeon ex4484_58]
MNKHIITLLMTLLIIFPYTSIVYMDNSIEWKYYIKQDVVTDFSYKIARYGAPAGVYDIDVNYRMTGELDVELILTNDTFKVKSKYNCTGGWVRSVGKDLNRFEKLVPGEDPCIVHKYEVTYRDINEYLTKSFSPSEELNRSLSRVHGVLPENTVFNVTVKYGGLTTYKDLLTNVFYIHMDFKGYGASGKVRGYFDGVTYVYGGLPIPIYRNLSFYMETYSLEGRISYYMKETAELTEHNLSEYIQYGYIEVNEAKIILGGFPDAKLRVTGSNGDNKLYVVNEGSDLGFVIIVYEGGSSLKNSTNETPSYFIYAVEPGKDKTLELKTTLDRDIDVSSSTRTSTKKLFEEALPMIILALIAVFIVIAIIYSSKRARSK